jgi:hypothetical protein
VKDRANSRRRGGFVAQWVSEWNSLARAEPRAGELWEGAQAYKELSGRLSLLLPGKGTPLLKQLLQHARCFRGVGAALAEYKTGTQQFTDLEKYIDGILQPFLSGQIQDLASELNRTARLEAWVQKQELAQFWKAQLTPYPKVSRAAQTFCTPRYARDHRFLAPARVIERAERTFAPIDFPKHYGSMENLHTWLQLRCAIVFKLFLSRGDTRSSKLTLLTTARLIALFYISAGLAKRKLSDNFAELKIPGSKRKFTVIGIYQKLKRYKIDRPELGFRAVPEVFLTGRIPPQRTVDLIYCKNFQQVVRELGARSELGPTIRIEKACDTLLDRWSDGAVSVEFSPESSIRNNELLSQGYTLVGVRDAKGVLKCPFSKQDESAAAQQVILAAVSSGF